MRISVAKYGDSEELVTVDIASDMTIQDLKVIIASESDFGLEPNQMNLYYDGKLLKDGNQTLEQTNLKDYAVVTCRPRPSNERASSRATTGMPPVFDINNIRSLFNEIRSNPIVFGQLRQSDPALASVIERDDINEFMRYIMTRNPGRGVRQQPQPDLLDPQIQRRIEEVISMENLRDNMEHAYEHAPEFFGNVVMLYINCKVNSHPVKAFVDSGAQMTIMSKACAERCGIMRLIDTRFSGIAKGVGTQKILGRVHMAQLEVEKQYFTTSLSVLEEQSMDMLIGLDMLRRHRCVVDLHKNVLRIENSVETSFLSESELPAHARLSGSATGAEENDLSEALLQSTAETGDSPRQQRLDRHAASSTASSSPFPEKVIKEITKKGFTREQAIEELKLANGDVTKALLTLLTKSLTKPKRKN